MRLDIAVNDLVMMGVIQRIADLPRNMYGFLHLKGSLFLDPVIERCAFDILHDNIVHVIFLTDVVDANHVRMRQ